MKTKGIVWFRQDLRINDNEAIVEAVSHCDEVIYIYVFDEREWSGKTKYGFDKTAEHRKRFLYECVEDLDTQLKRKGGHLHVAYGRPEDIIFDLAQKERTSWVFCNRERTQEEVKVQDALEESLWTIGQEVRFSRGKMLYHTADLPFPVNQTPDQFTAFRKEVEKITPIRKPLPVPSDLKSSRSIMPSDWPELPKANKREDVYQFKGGTDAGLVRLYHYFWESGNIKSYKKTRNGMLGADFSSRFSPWLAHGALSPKFIYHELKKYEEENGANESTYWLFFELLWRDFFRLMGKKHGNRIFQEAGYAPRPRQAGQENYMSFEKWAKGETGTPLVDACMKELKTTGWMSNRGRQIVASFLVNDLKLHWLMGAEYFESLLIDYDPCSNYGNWAYIAGVGSDTRSDRYFNVVSQARKYDPQGDYVRFWIKELESIKDFKIHLPDQLVKEDRERWKVNPSGTYLRPLISSHRWTG